MEDSYWVKRLGIEGARVRAEHISAGLARYHSNKTPEQKVVFSEKMRIRGQKGHEKIKELSQDSDWKANWLNNSLRSEKALKNCAESTKRYWDSLPSEKKEDYVKKTIHSSESRKKAGATIKSWWDNASSEERNARVKAFTKNLHRKPNKPETVLLNYLNVHCPSEWEYTGDGKVWLGNRNPDFTNINGQKMVIEVWGTYWHRNGKPEELKAHYSKYGFGCIVIWEDECNESDLARILGEV